MSRTFLVLMSILVALGAWNHFRSRAEPPPSAPTGVDEMAAGIAASSRNTVVVYGRDGCGYTRRMLASLRELRIPVTYIDLDGAAASDAFHDRFDGTGLADHRGYALPVVDVTGEVSMRPSPETVAYQFQTRD